MAKMRGIKPETFTDSKIVRMSPLARYLFIGLWTLACDNGHVHADEMELKIRLLPGDNADVGELLTEMEKVGVIRREPDVITVCNLRKHQKIDRRFFKTCDLPTCVDPYKDQITPPTRRVPDENTTSARRNHHDEGEGEGEGESNFTSRIADATPQRDDVEELLDYLDEAITANGSKKPSRSKRNRDAMRLMLDRDGYSADQIRAAIDWAQNDDFWRANILSAHKLRAKYDQLRLQAQRSRAPGGYRNQNQIVSDMQVRAAQRDQQAAMEQSDLVRFIEGGKTA